MKIVIIGGSGFIGSRLSREFTRRGYSVVSVDRNPPKISGVAFVSCSGEESIPQVKLLENPTVVINLAGRSIVGPWDQEHKDSIYSSRIQTTQNIVSLFKNKLFRPEVFIQASAVGIYGNRGEEVLSEGSPVGTNTFLSKVASDWEKAGSQALKYGIRTVILRQATVLSSEGFLSNLIPLYKKGLGAPVGDGNNWFPWIHINDLISIYIRSIESESMSGVFNACAPESVRYKEFSRQLAKTLHRPHFFRIPRFLFRLKYKGFTDEITASQKVISLRLWESGIVFSCKTLQDALTSIVK